MPKEIDPKEKVITTAVTSGRITYPKFKPVKDLPEELQKKVKERGFVKTYGKVYKPTEKNLDYKKKADVLSRQVETLKETIQQLNKQITEMKKKVVK